MIGGDIFKDGASPELEAWWKERDDAIEAYKVSDSPAEKILILRQYPEIRDDVLCRECGHELE